MKKRFFSISLLFLLTSICFAETIKYRYAFVTEQSVVIADVKEKIPEDKLNDPYQMILPMNTKQERFIAESGFKNIQSYFYSGIPFIYIDYTKNAKDPDMSYIDSWTDGIAYVRGSK